MINSIDLQKAELLIPYLDTLDADQITFQKGQYLLIDKMLIDLHSDDSIHNDFPYHETTINYNDSTEQTDNEIRFRNKILNLLIESNCQHIIRDNNTYFFIEGGWIDSKIGKAYTKQPYIDKNRFTFDRVQEFDKVDNVDNWYEFYAD